MNFISKAFRSIAINFAYNMAEAVSYQKQTYLLHPDQFYELVYNFQYKYFLKQKNHKAVKKLQKLRQKVERNKSTWEEIAYKIKKIVKYP